MFISRARSAREIGWCVRTRSSAMRVLISREVPRRAIRKFFWLILRTKVVFVAGCNKRAKLRVEPGRGRGAVSPAQTAPCLFWKAEESCFGGDSQGKTLKLGD